MFIPDSKKEQLQKIIKKESALNEAVEFLQKEFVPQMHQDKIKMDNFRDVYPENKIEKDKEDLKRKQERYHKADKHERAEILEALLYNQIELNNWFGENACTVIASEYDDEFHGVDFVIEFDLDEGRIERLAIDVTTSRNQEVIDEKWKKISSPLIQSGDFTTLEYFASEINDTKGRIEMPHIILGIDAGNFDSVAKEIAQKIKTGQKKELGEHFLKYDLLEMASEQLKYLHEIAEKVASRDKKEKLQILIDEIKRILETKEKLPRRIGSRNEVYMAIHRIVERAV